MKVLIATLLIALNAHAYEFCTYVDEPCDAQGDHYSCFHAWADGSYCAATDVSNYARPRPLPLPLPTSAPARQQDADRACEEACAPDQWGYKACLDLCRPPSRAVFI